MSAQFQLQWLGAMALLVGQHDAALAETIVDASPEIAGQQCNLGEELIFAGDVEDDFGLGIAVCLQGETITVRYSGEGDPQAVSCQIGQCADLIEFTHYVRYRFTVLTLTWRDENGEQELTESFDAQEKGQMPVHSVQHTWTPAAYKETDDASAVYPVRAITAPLSLLALDKYEWP